MCSRRILQELVMHLSMSMSINNVNVYGESTYTKIWERYLWWLSSAYGMCSRRILQELVMHLSMSINDVNVYNMASLHTRRYEKDIFDVFLPRTFPYVCTDSYKILISLDLWNRIFCVSTGDVRILNITLKPEAGEPLDPWRLSVVSHISDWLI